MKASLVRVASLLVLTLAGCAGAGMAQSAPTIKANIPFDFTVGNQSFPAGQYSLARPSPNLVLLRNAKGSTVAMAFTRELADDPQAPLSTILKFEVAGDHRQLIEAWSKDEPEGLSLNWTAPKSATSKANRSVEVSAVVNR
jgi:hypothetical protein